jgi:hypothetical protein
MDIAVLGIDLGKNSCSVVGLDFTGKVVLRRPMIAPRSRRGELGAGKHAMDGRLAAFEFFGELGDRGGHGRATCHGDSRN